MSIHAFTSVTCNYIPKARVLAHSLKRLHPEIEFHLVLSDAVPNWLDLGSEPFDTIIHVTQLGIPDVEQWLFKHTVVEACTAVKGAAVLKLLSLPGCSGVLYFDPDMALLSSMAALLGEFSGFDVLLTPHLTQPETRMEAILDNEFSVLRHGIYNLGFVGVKNSPDGLRFAHWWADRLYHFCYDDIPRGIFTDQRWIDLAPACFGGVRILRGPEYNVATWNLTHREVTGSLRMGILSNGRPLVFYHFSGFDSGAQEAMLKKYGATMPVLFELREWYLAECQKMGQSDLGNVPWSYANFDNGRPIQKIHRIRYRERGDLQKAFPDPYATGNRNKSYYHWFESNDESAQPTALNPPAPPSPLPLKAAVAVTKPEVPRYSIVISLVGVEDDGVRQHFENIVSRTHSREPVCVIGDSSALDALRDVPPGRILERILLPNQAAEEADLLAALARNESRDLLFVRATCMLPNWWDIRLAWSAYRSPGIATASPLDVNGVRIDEADASIYTSSSFVHPPLQTFSRRCVYIRRAAIQDVGSSSGSADFLKRSLQMRWSHVLADHICKTGEDRIEGAEGGAHVIAEGLRHCAVSSSQRANPQVAAIRRQLHVMHSWGGGLEHWVREYCRNDSTHRNFVLKSIGTWGAFGQELRLYRHIDDPSPIRHFPIAPSVKHTAGRHAAYRAALEEICHEFGIDAIVVSSLIGHSLDVLRSGLPTLMVCHDFYPYCPALNVTFKKPCQTCGASDLHHCTRENPHHRFFRNVPGPEWIQLRQQFQQAIRENNVRMIAPSPSVIEGYGRFIPELREYFRLIPHGTRPLQGAPLNLTLPERSRLRLVVLGSLAPHKGGELLLEVLPDLLKFADLYLLGCGEWSAPFVRKGVTVFPEYQWEELSRQLQAINPHVGLLLSVVPETFSYTLHELLEMAIPTVATRIGSFADVIEDGRNGFLIDPGPIHVLTKLRRLAANPAELRGVHQRLKDLRAWRMPEMLAEYEAVIGLPDVSATAYFAPDGRVSALAARGPTVQLYWRSDDGTCEEKCSTTVQLKQSTEPFTVALRLPSESKPLASLRLDFDSDVGSIQVSRIRLITNTGEEMWSWNYRHGSIDAGICFDLTWTNGDRGALLTVTGPDPRILLPADESAVRAVSNGGLVEVEIAFSIGNDANGRATRLLHRPEYHGVESRGLVSLRPIIDSRGAGFSPTSSAGASADFLLDQVVNLKHRVHELEQSISWKITAPLRNVYGLLLKFKTAVCANIAVK